SLSHEPELRERVAALARRRDQFADALRAHGWHIPVAQGNFVWLPTLERTEEIAEALFNAGIVARPFAGEGIRVSIGEEPALETALAVLERFAS
ncbi:MAG: aminotransferase class I/II-fold pyridoxal phosphate-dependent enzyme, partial [Agromyces sp.]